MDQKSTVRPGARTADGLSEDERLGLQAVFECVDTSGEGQLDWKELHHALYGLGFRVTSSEAQELVKGRSRDGAGMIIFEEFVEIVEDLSLSDRDVRRELEQAFKALDVENAGCLTVDALKAFCRQVGEHMTESELRQMVAEANVSGTGRVTLDEFIAVMLKTNIYR